MSSEITNLPEIVAPTPVDVELAEESSRQLARLLNKSTLENHFVPLRLHLQIDNNQEEVVVLPGCVLHPLVDILTHIARGCTFKLMSVRAELTTQQAADILNVSRPFLIKLMEQGKIPFRRVGSHRRIRFDDLLSYKQSIDQQRIQVLAELTREAQELNMGY